MRLIFCMDTILTLRTIHRKYEFAGLRIFAKGKKTQPNKFIFSVNNPKTKSSVHAKNQSPTLSRLSIISICHFSDFCYFWPKEES